jgi:hypothetical protein
MKVEVGNVYVTEFGTLLRLESIGEVLYNFQIVDEQLNPIPTRRNRNGQVTFRSKVQYTQEIFITFKPLK